MLTWLQSQEENENGFQIISTKIPAGIFALRGYAASLYYGENSAAYAGYDNACDNYAAEDYGEGHLHADVEQGGDESARPCAGSGEGDGDQYKQAQQFVFENKLSFFLCAVFETGDFVLKPSRLPAHPGENLSHKEDDYRYGQHISDNGGCKSEPYGQICS